MLEHIKFRNNDYVKGVVEKVFVNHGQEVAADQSLATISTQFKTYNIIAEKPGIIEDISIEPGMVINHNSRIFNINVRQDYLSNFETETIFDEFFMETLGDDLKYGTDNTIFKNKISNKNDANAENKINKNLKSLNKEFIEDNNVNDKNKTPSLDKHRYEDEIIEDVNSKADGYFDKTNYVEQKSFDNSAIYNNSVNDDIKFSEIVDILKPIIADEKEINEDFFEAESNLLKQELSSSAKLNIQTNLNENAQNNNQKNLMNENNIQKEANIEKIVNLADESQLLNNYELLKNEFKQTLDLVKNFQSNIQNNESASNEQIISELKNEINDLKNIVKELKQNTSIVNVPNKQINQKINNDNIQATNNNFKIESELILDDKRNFNNLKNKSKSIKTNKIRLKNKPSINQIEAEIDITSLQTLYGVMNESYVNNNINLPIETFYILALAKSLGIYSIFNSTFDKTNEEVVNNKNININCSVLVDTSIHYVLIEKVESLETQNLVKIVNQKINEVKRITNKNKNFLLSNGTISLTDFNALGINFGKINLVNNQVAHIGIGAKIKRPVISDGKMTERIFTNISLAYNEDVINLADAAAFLLHFGKTLSNPGFLI